jgi:hypothetical protein
MAVTPLTRARYAFTALALAGAASLGLLAAARVPGARADTGVPVPSIPAPPVTAPAVPTVPPVSVPPLPVTVPLPGATTTTTTDPGLPTTDPGATATGGTTGSEHRTPESARVSGDQATVAGVVRLRSGRFSIPATSVLPPVRLVLSRVRVQPGQVGKARQALLAAFRVSDSRGYLVRGVRVDIGSLPTGRIHARRVFSGIDGNVTVALQTTPLLALRRGTLTLIFESSVPGQPRGLVKSLVRIPVRPAR